LRLDYWSLVLASLAGSLFGTFARVIIVRWRPKLRFKQESFRFQFRYGINGLGLSIVNYFHNNIDYLLVGRLLGASLLGLYEFAYRIPHLLEQRLGGPVGSVVFPTLARSQASDRRLIAGYTKAAKYIALIVFPLLAGLAALARPAVLTLWGERWLPITLPLQLLCFPAALRAVGGPIGAVFLCKGRPDIPFKLMLARLAFTFAAVGILGYFFGLVGIAAGVAVSVLPFFLNLWVAAKLTRTSVLSLPRALGPVLIAAATCYATAWSVRYAVGSWGGANWQILVFAVPAGGLAYVLTYMLFLRGEVADISRTVRTVLGRSKPRDTTQ